MIFKIDQYLQTIRRIAEIIRNRTSKISIVCKNEKSFDAISEIFKTLPVWDLKWYLARYPDVAASEIDGLYHYLSYGIAEGRNPGPYYNLINRFTLRHDALRQRPLEYATALIDDVHQNPLFDLLKDPAATLAASGLFESVWYLERYADVRADGQDPLRHYVERGGSELRWPGPRFNPDTYIQEQGLPTNPPVNVLLHYLVNGGSRKGNALDIEMLRRRALAQTIDMLPLESDLASAFNQLTAGTMPVVNANRSYKLSRCWRLVFSRLSQPYQHVILVPWLSHGGADRVALHAARLALQCHAEGEVLLIVADSDEVTAREWTPRGLHILVLSEIDRTLDLAERVELLLLIMRALKPRGVLNVNSHAGWELYEQYGRPLSTFTRLFATLFCPDYDKNGLLIGYAHRYFRSTLPNVTAIYFDNNSFIEELIEYYAPPNHSKEKLRTIYQPLASSIFYQRIKSDASFSVLWASRLCVQKNLPTLLKVARADVDISYAVYGRGDDEHTTMMDQAAQTLPNLDFRGSYSSFESLPLHCFDVYIYTTLWDGLPNVLLEAGAAGLPVVAPPAGGIGELVTAETGWLVASPTDTVGYVRALREIRDFPEEAARRSAAMKALIATRHAWPAYAAAMSVQPSFTHP